MTAARMYEAYRALVAELADLRQASDLARRAGRELTEADWGRWDSVCGRMTTLVSQLRALKTCPAGSWCTISNYERQSS